MGSARIARVSQHCLCENCPQMLEMNSGHLITLQIWMEWRYHVWERRKKLFWNLHPKSKTVSELQVALEKTSDNFLQLQFIKLSRVLQIVWQEYVNGDGRHFKHLSLPKKVFALTAFALCWIVEAIFDNISTAKLPWANGMKLSTFTENWMSNQCAIFFYRTSLQLLKN